MRKSYDGARSSETHRGDRKRPSLPEEVLLRPSEKKRERSRAKNIHRWPIANTRVVVASVQIEEEEEEKEEEEKEAEK